MAEQKERKKWTGKGIGVAVLDTGIFPHMDFDGRIAVFKDFISGRRSCYDDNGHGTHVAGILAGSGAASGGKYCGMAPGAHLAVLKVLDQRGNGQKQDVVRALRWVLENRERYGIRVVNISVGTTEKNRNHSALIRAVEEVWDAGLVVVTAAGNMGPAPGSITAPGCSRKVITVGSSDLLSGQDSISGIGPTRECVVKPDLVTWGSGITSCSASGRDKYAVKSGTSMSTPRIAGAAACMLEKDPRLTNREIKMLLRESARDLGYGKNQQGWGAFDLEKFLSL